MMPVPVEAGRGQPARVKAAGPLSPTISAAAAALLPQLQVTRVLLPPQSPCSGADTTAVIGSVSLDSARVAGYRRIAAQVDRPLSTVRRHDPLT